MAIKKLILHMGMYKTGTSSIQATLVSPLNKTLLRQEGFYFLEELGDNHSVPIFNMFRAMTSPEERLALYQGHDNTDIQRQNQRNFDIIHNIVSSAREETLIISGESFSGFGEAAHQNLRNYFSSLGISTIQALLYVRNPVDYCTSYLQTIIRMGLPINGLLPHMYEGKLPLYQEAIERIEAVYGAAQLSIFSFEDALRDFGDPVHHFLHTLGLSEGTIRLFDIQKSNESMCQEVVEFFSYFNEEVPTFALRPFRRPDPFSIPDNGVVEKNEKRMQYDFSGFLGIVGEKFSLDSSAQKKIAEALLPKALWLRDKTGIDYVDDTRRVLADGPKPPSASPPETYDALFVVFTYLCDASRLFFLTFLNEKQQISPLWKSLYYRCSIFFSNTLKRRNPALFDDSMQYMTSRGRAWELYFDVGAGFSGEWYVTQEYPAEDGSELLNQEITVDLTTYSGLCALRFDPASSPCLLRMKSIAVREGDTWHPLALKSANTSLRYGQTLFFEDTDDPRIFLATPSSTAEKLRIRFDIIFSARIIWQQIQLDIRRHQKEQAQWQSDNAAQQQTLHRLKSENARLSEHNMALEDRSRRLGKIESTLPYRILSKLKRWLAKE